MRDPEFPKGLQLEVPVLRELEADLSTLDDEEIRREGKREVLRRRRDERRAAKDAKAQESARQTTQRWVQIRIFWLLAYIAFVATVVTIVGALNEDVEVVRAGIAALCAVGGLGIYRLPFWVGRR